MANTGYKINPVLKKVTDDINEYPLDVNNQLTSVSGLPQAVMNMPIEDPRYREYNLDDCPVDPNIDFLYTVSHGTNPFTQTGFSLNGNYVVQPDNTTNNLNGVFFKGDNIVFDLTSRLLNYPWETGSSANINLKVNGVVVHNFTATTQANIMNTYTLNTDSSTNSIELLVTGSSTATNRLTRTLDTYIFNSPTNQIRAKIVDTTGTSTKLDIPIIANGNKLLYNIVNDSNTVTLTITNNSSATKYFHVEGLSFTQNVTVAASSFVNVTGIPKGSNVYLLDVEGAGYVRYQLFQRNNCSSGTGGYVPFAKSYVDEATATADTTNFNSLGQARANTYGECII